ncbi:MAG: hypothetical protein IT167_12700 [Bryobacterales bacterium]|nr:hypothetical protein [Bryobacterales bacterium]
MPAAGRGRQAERGRGDYAGAAFRSLTAGFAAAATGSFVVVIAMAPGRGWDAGRCQ